jgi:hypothetical protein
MSVSVRPATLGDGIKVLDLLENVGYFPEPIGYAETYRKSLTDPRHIVRVAEINGRIVGLATLSLRWQLGLGGLLASLDELAVTSGVPKSVTRHLLRATVGKARQMGAIRVLKRANENTPPPRPAPGVHAAPLLASA